MKTLMTKLKLGWVTLWFLTGLTALAESPAIIAFGQNGQLVCSNLPPGGTAVVEWSASPSGPWRTNWTGLDAVTASSNGVIQVSVPMFYRVRSVASNHAPVAVDDLDSTPEDTPLIRATSVYRANDSDPDGDTLTITAVSGAINGTVTLTGTNITFTPAANFSGSAGYDYTVSDGTLTDVGHVTVTVTAVNDPPIAVDDNASTSANTTLSQNASVYLANDTDVDSSLSISAVSNPVNGIVFLSGSTVIFVPDTDFTGIAGFDYTVSDGALTDIGHVSILVN